MKKKEVNGKYCTAPDQEKIVWKNTVCAVKLNV